MRYTEIEKDTRRWEMTVLMQLEKNMGRYMLVIVEDDCVQAEIEALVNTGSYNQAREMALEKGELLRLISEHEKPHVEVDVMISSQNYHRDLTQNK